MTMKNMLLDNNWQQLTDGTKTVKIQVLNTPVRYAEINTLPNDSSPFFLLQPGLYEAGPEISYVCADMKSAFIVVIEKVVP
ncbi:hypothetical protein AXA88_09050 [Salmonella enterica]|nr:hypothetical protein [Salmonella enterica]EAX3606051.1 hypothetical protein [Salmonella enterica]EGW6279532.1 hypothetical protein [Salmonella enterica]EGX3932957.1 hypothetical protein [Salmonella enterica]